VKKPRDEGEASELFAVACSALIRAMGMHAENMARQVRGEAMAFADNSFFYAAQSIDEWGEYQKESSDAPA